MDKILDDILESNKGLSTHEQEDVVLKPLLEEIDLIENEGIKKFVRSLLLRAGPFWIIPSSFLSDDKPPDEYLPTGNILHTKRVVRATRLVAESYSCNEEEMDKLTAAAILHDVTKAFITEESYEPIYDVMHPYTLDRFARSVNALDEAYSTEENSSTLYVEDIVVQEILRLVRCHLGPWSPIPETNPITVPEMILHLGDRIASSLHWIIDGEDVKEYRWKIIPPGEQE